MRGCATGGQYYQYDPDLPSKWGIMPRDGDPARDMRWFDIPGIVMGHVMNAYTEGDKVIVDTPASPGNCFCFFKDKHGNLPDHGRDGDADHPHHLRPFEARRSRR